ncbi:MAG: hypothetical protein KDB86_03155 [Actinobacteria bacterium]|nr:hypothetical protein [Actinomycetota bacterium]MCB9388655.1 hypothetical protein [Acidimicrobiia bacterium]
MTAQQEPSFDCGGDLPVDCAQVAVYVQSFIDGEHVSISIEALEVHLDRCAPCGLEADDFRRLKVALARRKSERSMVDLLRCCCQSILETGKL